MVYFEIFFIIRKKYYLLRIDVLPDFHGPRGSHSYEKDLFAIIDAKTGLMKFSIIPTVSLKSAV